MSTPLVSRQLSFGKGLWRGGMISPSSGRLTHDLVSMEKQTASAQAC